MKKSILILSTIALIAAGCNKTNKSNSGNGYGGIYTFGDTSKESTTRNGEVYIYPENDSTLLFYLFVIKGEPSYNSGSIEGRMKVRNGIAVFRKHFDYEELDCVLQFKFSENKLTVICEQCGCGFGNGVYVQDTFQRTSSEIPPYYVDITNEKVYFKNWEPEEENCTTSYIEDEMTTIVTCVHENKNLQQVYDILKQKSELNLKPELPAGNLKYNTEDTPQITYQYKTPKHLWIELFYEGGVTTVEIIEEQNTTTSIITYSAD